MVKHREFEQTPEVLGLKTLIEDLQNRIKAIGTVSGMILESSDGSLAKNFYHLQQDAERTLASTKDYLKKIGFEHSDEEEATIQAVIPVTAEAARLVFDKRFLELMKKATSADISSKDVEKITKGYIKKFRTDIDASLPDPVLGIDALLKKGGDPWRPHFSQTKAENKFSATPNTSTSSSDILGKSVQQVGKEIKEGRLSKDVVNVGVFYHKGAWVCSNNRSFAAASVSQIQPRLEVIFPNEEFIKFYEAKKEGGGGKHRKQPVDLHSIALEDKSDKNPYNWPMVSVPPVWYKSSEEALAAEKQASSSASAASHFGASFEKISAEPKTLEERVLDEGDEEAGEAVEDSPLNPMKP